MDEENKERDTLENEMTTMNGNSLEKCFIMLSSVMRNMCIEIKLYISCKFQEKQRDKKTKVITPGKNKRLYI